VPARTAAAIRALVAGRSDLPISSALLPVKIMSRYERNVAASI
jgi:hypothetical protein